MNINRDYLIILDVKSGEVDSPNIYYFNTDKNTSNLYVQMVIKETNIEATPIDNATNYSIKANILKPNMVGKIVEGDLVNEEKAIYEFKLPADCTDFSGNAKIEFEVYCTVDGVEEIATSFATKFKVHGSVLTEQNKYIEDSSDYPILKELMAEVKVINETARELDTAIRTLQADMIEANEEMKTNEVTRQANENARVTNENARKEAERTRSNQEAARVEAETTREEQEATRVTNENDRIYKEDRRESQERDRTSNEYDRQNAEQSREYAEIDRVANEEIRQTNEANRETAEQIRRTNEQARITAETARVTEHEQMRTELAEVKAENAILMENDKKVSDRMTQVEISDKRQYVIMEGLMNSAGDGYLKIEDTGNDTTLYNSVEGFVDVKNITGNTMVNSIKNPDDELTLNADINTSGQSVTLTTAVDNGQVDVLAEGNTMVNVCDQQEAVAITKSYTVETGNHVALQGEYDGKARPVVQGNTLVNLCTNDDSYFPYALQNDDKTNQRVFTIKTAYNLDSTKKYTIIFELIDVTNSSDNINQLAFQDGLKDNMLPLKNGIQSYVFNPGNTHILNLRIPVAGVTAGCYGTIKSFMILEGDYTNKPIPDYFTGMQSSFEDKVVTQEMVDNGKELAENLGKYRVDYKVTGKNKWNGSKYTRGSFKDGAQNSWVNYGLSDFIPVVPNTLYVTNKPKYNGSVVNNVDFRYGFYNSNKELIFTMNSTSIYTFTTTSDCHYVKISHKMIESGTIDVSLISEWQLEEGTVATSYESYKEFTKTYYLNSPLLEGDTIEESNGNVYHVHRYGKVIITKDSEIYTRSSGVNAGTNGLYSYGFSAPYKVSNNANLINTINDKLPDITFQDGYVLAKSGLCVSNATNSTSLVFITNHTTVDEFKTWLQSNPVTAVYKLASPQYELISQSDTILTDSYVAGHLDFDTAVPVERVAFINHSPFKLKYLYPSTKYNIQFESDNIGKASISIGGRFKDFFDVTKGINKVSITTLDSPTSQYMGFSGIGFSASNIVVTEATDKDFGYFSGMKSVGELEENKIEILSKNKNLCENSNYVNYAIGGNGGNQYFYSGRCQLYIVHVKENTKYSISKEGGDRFVVASHKGIPKANQHVKILTRAQQGVFRTSVTTPVGHDTLLVYVSSNITNDLATNIQVEEGTEATDYVPHAENKKQILLNEPLRAVGDTKDRFVQIDGKWYVERNTAEVVLNSTNCTLMGDGGTTDSPTKVYQFIPSNLGKSSSMNIISDIMYTSEAAWWGTGEYIALNVDGYIQFRLTPSKFSTMVQNVVYQLASPTYEPVEIAPVLNTYTDVTHITNNSTIPMNMPIVNSGYEVIAKPSTKYTVVGIDSGRIGDSTIVNGTITTPATITDNFLRPYGTGKTSKVMLLEGEPANIPGYFKGIKSVFEDKVTEDGKYACEVRVYNDLGEETKQTLYLDEPLYNANNITIYNDKLGYWKNWDKVVLDGSEDEEWWDTSQFSISNNTIEFRGGYGINIIKNSNVLSDLFASTPDIWTKDIENISPIEGNCIDIRIHKAKLSTQDLTGFRQYLSENPVTVVYQLAEPVFVPLIDNCPNWVIGSWDNCSIHFDSIIPLKDTRYRYTGNVPSVVAMSDDVAETKSISDEQDNLIVDLATQVAVLEMMTL